MSEAVGKVYPSLGVVECVACKRLWPIGHDDFAAHPCKTQPTDADVERLAMHLCEAACPAGWPVGAAQWREDDRNEWRAVARAAIALGADPTQVPQ